MRIYGLSLIVLLIILSSCKKENKQFSFTANINHIGSKNVIAIKEYANGSYLFDTLTVSKNSFEYTETKDSLVSVRLYINGNSCVLDLYADTPGRLTLTGDAKQPENIQIVGTKTNDDLNEFRKANSKLLQNIRVNELMLSKIPKDSAGVVKRKRIVHTLDSLHAVAPGLVKAFVMKHPDSGASAILIRDYTLNYQNVQLTESLLKVLTPQA